MKTRIKIIEEGNKKIFIPQSRILFFWTSWCCSMGGLTSFETEQEARKFLSEINNKKITYINV